MRIDFLFSVQNKKREKGNKIKSERKVEGKIGGGFKIVCGRTRGWLRVTLRKASARFSGRVFDFRERTAARISMLPISLQRRCPDAAIRANVVLPSDTAGTVADVLRL